MASLSSLGVGAGIDTAAMLAQIQAAEQTRLTPYTNLKSSYEGKISAWGKISSALSSLQESVNKLSGEAFNTLTLSDNKAFKATATSEASADTHAISVSQLAVAHKLKTAGHANADTALGSATDDTRVITITQKNGNTLTVTLADDETSLNQMAKAINKQDGDVRASVQRSDEGYQLVLSSRTTGTEGEMSVTVTGDDRLGELLNTQNGGQQVDENGYPIEGAGRNDAMIAVSAAQDARLKVDGISYTRSNNNISDIISGVTLSLVAVSTDDSPEQLTLTVDTSAIKTTLQEFVKHYNALLSQTSSASKYVANDTAGLTEADVAKPNSENGALMGDGTLRSMVSEIRSAVNGVYGERHSDYNALTALGIKIDATTGQMTLDEKVLDEAIADSPEDIGALFKGVKAEEGLATVLAESITKYIGDKDKKIDGIIKTATDSLDQQSTLIKTQIEKTQKLIDAQVERYRVQFQNLDSTMSKLNGLNNQLLSVLSTL